MASKSLLNITKEYCEISTIHGLPLIVARKIHILERIFWIIMVILAILGAIGLCLSNWQRYKENPTVVSLEKDFRNWHNPFPAATGCFLDRANKEMTDKYIQKQWNIEKSDSRYEYYLHFVQAVTNISYQTMANFKDFQGDKTLQGIDLLDLAIKVHPVLTGDLVTFDAKRKTFWDIIVTENGICFSANFKFSHIFLAEKKNNTNIINSEYSLECHYLNGLCYARYDSDPYLAINYYVHSPYEIIHTTSTAPLYLPQKSELEINYQMQETRPADSLRRLTVSQRQCRFYDEPLTPEIPAYGSGICYMICRYRFALKKCGCKPYFYHKLSGKVCDVDGMMCLSNHVDFFTEFNPKKVGCNCDEPCRVITYFPQIAKLTEWASGYFDQRVTFRWGLQHPTTRFMRDVLFGFEDLVVSFGGTASLFFGMSFLSIAEFILFVLKNIIIKIFTFKNKNLQNDLNNINISETLKTIDKRNAENLFVKVKPFSQDPATTFNTLNNDWKLLHNRNRRMANFSDYRMSYYN